MRKLVMSLFVIGVVAGCAPKEAPPVEKAGEPAEADGADECNALFVQEADGMSFDGSKLTLKNANLDLIYFCDRPVREAGHITREAFLSLGTKGEDSFAKNHPNAALSIFGEEDLTEVVVELSEKPVANGVDFIFPIKVIEGEVPAEGGQVVMFIDPIGMPMTPTSVAGAHRRHRRRAHRHHQNAAQHHHAAHHHHNAAHHGAAGHHR
ncbi:MAG: hypothetical protein HKN10_11150 [Myxococcales bacterium]|nr:hypothetical protein [Myxococcales bacterium]